MSPRTPAIMSTLCTEVGSVCCEDLSRSVTVSVNCGCTAPPMLMLILTLFGAFTLNTGLKINDACCSRSLCYYAAGTALHLTL